MSSKFESRVGQVWVNYGEDVHDVVLVICKLGSSTTHNPGDLTWEFQVVYLTTDNLFEAGAVSTWFETDSRPWEKFFNLKRLG